MILFLLSCWNSIDSTTKSTRTIGEESKPMAKATSKVIPTKLNNEVQSDTLDKESEYEDEGYVESDLPTELNGFIDDKNNRFNSLKSIPDNIIFQEYNPPRKIIQQNGKMVISIYDNNQWTTAIKLEDFDNEDPRSLWVTFVKKQKYSTLKEIPLKEIFYKQSILYVKQNGAIFRKERDDWINVGNI